MRFAEKEGYRIFPNPLEKNAICPLCKNPVISKCGNIKVWHWCHKNINDCDSFGEPETEWHLNWKNEFPEEYQEIIIGNHRADIKIKDIVIEFQNSPISQEAIIERENFYGKMKWVLNGKTFAKNLNLFEKNGFYSFKWKWFPKSLASAKRQIYIDLSHLKLNLIKEIEKYSNGDKHYNKIKHCTYEWEDEYGNIRDGDYPHYYNEYYEDTKLYIDKLKKKLEILISKDIFIIKKLSDFGTGWGKLISKKQFIEDIKDGYYGN